MKLFWKLFRDPKVSAYRKILPVVSGIICSAYVILPFDVLPDPYAFFGQLDDMTVILLIMAPSIWLFVRICPKDLVKEYAHQIAGGVSRR